MASESDGQTQKFDPNEPTQAAKPSGYVGVLLKNRYLIEREIGRGGFGVVYKAKDQQLHGRVVVIKILTQDFTADPWTLRKFNQEIEALARIDHPGVVGALDTGETLDGKPFLVLQFVEGVTLRSEIDKGKLSIERTAEITRQIGSALSAAHEKGVWHRDLKPENVMLHKVSDTEEYVKLIDFGIAAIRDSQFNAKDSQSTRVAGSFAYMSPEQFQGKPAPESDVWAFGIIVWEMLTTKKPFEADSLFELMIQQQKGVTTDPRELRRDLPEAAAKALLKSLAVDPAHRYKKPKEFGDAFAKAAGASGSSTVDSADRANTERMTRPIIDLNRHTERLDMAHILFVDLVGYSAMPMDKQRDSLGLLQEMVRSTQAFQGADASGELLRLPTGDGMALTFFGDPTAPVECAVQLARALRGHPELKLRTGVHSGPVYRVPDINANLNVSGGGINMAQRVMDAGDAGHILVSDIVAGVLSQLGSWSGSLKDLGMHEVKHGVKVHLYNLVAEGAGNPAVPSKLAKGQVGGGGANGTGGGTQDGQSRRGLIAAAGVLVLAGSGGAAYYFWKEKPLPPPPTPALELQYFITLQRMKDKQPDGPEFQLAREMVFTKDHRIKLTFTSPQAGHLYLCNWGPKGDFTILHPSPSQGIQSTLAAGATHVVGPIDFDAQEGTERLYVVWAAKQVSDLEQAANGSGGEAINGQIFIKDPARIKALTDFFDKHRADTKAQSDDDKKITSLKSPNQVLAYLINLEHH